VPTPIVPHPEQPTPQATRMRWRPIANAILIMALIAASALGILYLAQPAHAREGRKPHPIPIPAAHAKARAKCPLDKPLRCRAALVHAYEAIAWNRKQRLHQRQLSASNLTPVEVGRELAARRDWGGHQFWCLYTLWNRESGWQVHDRNWASQADGIPQANPASKMRAMGGDWRDNAATQIRWGLGYIAARYGTPCAALAHSNSQGYY
jgi:hypothetical protein